MHLPRQNSVILLSNIAADSRSILWRTSIRSARWRCLYMGIVALMGPVANIVAAIAGGLIFQAIAKFAPAFFTGEGFGSYVYLFLSFYVQVNVSLAVFNLLPIPPLDGSKILFVFLPDKAVAWFYRYQQIISIILLALLWVGVLRIPLSFLSGYVMKFVNWITALPFSFF